ncbi:helix-turn-helix transcriptional regulator [Kitasatospora kifunensis]|uniref:DNA-binding NarL/FixJ family response regulator n=1 Tax=Kitasatospora kifunensis TaxID=58351 RepID=A0A7W7QXF8_KITKI|nr:response regulator transcription factor [Kitasatospora kifunensis]MBB4921547.1 DNA-binding NarL/FixJ family response regulator [Kitasatospora kifunensis]
MSDKSVKAVTVAVLANDPVTGEGAVWWLSSCKDINASYWTWRHPADVLLVLATEITSDTLSRVERVQHETPDSVLPMVLVAHEFPEHHMLRAIDLGLVSYLNRHESGFDDIKRAIQEAAAEGRESSVGVQQALIGHIRALRDKALVPAGLNIAGLADREVEVLRFLAEGLSTKQISAKLSYSERTVKSIVHGVVTRLNLRNRTHAVVYALRTGVI